MGARWYHDMSQHEGAFLIGSDMPRRVRHKACKLDMVGSTTLLNYLVLPTSPSSIIGHVIIRHCMPNIRSVTAVGEYSKRSLE